MFYTYKSVDYLKPFLKGKILQSESERGVNSILINHFTILQHFLLACILFGSSRGSFLFLNVQNEPSLKIL